MAEEANVVRRGIYNVEYFSGAQVSLYIGDVWVDEVTTLNYGYVQNRTPIYGYASQLYDDLTEGQILINGTFTINFKEAGYLWLILDRYRRQLGRDSMIERAGPFTSSSSVNRQTVERLINNEVGIFERNSILLELAETQRDINRGTSGAGKYRNFLRDSDVYKRGQIETARSLAGYSSTARASGGIGRAENIFESFEDAVWSKTGEQLDQETRRTDDVRLNPFDMYVAFGDFAGDGSVNHTIERIRDVSILGKSKQIIIDGMPIQEQYTFIGRNLI